MAAAFTQTLRSLASDRPRASIAAIGLAAAVVIGWGVWMTTARVTVYAVTERARVEVEVRSYAVDAPIAGRIARVDATLGRDVREGDVLVELDAELLRRQLDELRARIASVQPQLDSTQRELVAQERALGDDERATLAALDEGKAHLEEARLAASQADDEAQRAQRLLDAGAIPQLELARLASQAAQRRASADATALATEKVLRDQRTRGSQALARIESLRGQAASLEGQRTTTLAQVRVVEQQIEQSSVRAPVTGRLGEVAAINAGAYVKPGDRLLSIVPPGDLRAVAELAPADALGRVRPGQSARLRLVGFPWMQYGTVAAKVTSVGSELREGRVRVELAIGPDVASGIPMQHGLPAIAEIDVERISPWRLVLRSIGARLGLPAQGGTEGGTAP